MYRLTLHLVDQPDAPLHHYAYGSYHDAILNYQCLNVQAQTSTQRRICRLMREDALLLEVVFPQLEGTDQSYMLSSERSRIQNASRGNDNPRPYATSSRNSSVQGPMRIIGRDGAQSPLICRDRSRPLQSSRGGATPPGRSWSSW